jgi:hypothetical protein
MTYDLTKSDFETITIFLLEAPCDRRGFVKLSIGLLGLNDVRSIIEQREPEEIEELPSADPDLSLTMQNYLNSLRGSEV